MRTLQILICFSLGFTYGFIQQPSCDDTSVYFPHENCSLFYHCVNGQPFLVPCPDGLYWNDPVNACDYPENIPECIGGTRPPVGTPTTTETLTTSRVTTELTTTPVPERPGCGEILTESNGTISYKESEEYKQNERCVWIIKVPGSIRIHVKMEECGIQGSTDGLLVSSIVFEDKETNSTEPKVTSERLSFEVDTVSQDSDVSVLLFYSSNKGPSKGFRVSYYVETGNFIRPGNAQILSDVPSQSLSYPETGVYKNDELSTFVYSPRFSFYPELNIQTLFKIKTMERYYDALYVYRFNIIEGSYTPVWQFEQRDQSNTSVLTNDTTLILFKTDRTTVGEGFTLDFTLNVNEID